VCRSDFATITQGPSAAPLLLSGIVTNVESVVIGQGRLVTFTVNRVWNGNVAKQIALGYIPMIDGVSLEQGGKYLIAAYEPVGLDRDSFPPGLFQISNCASSRIEEAERRGLRQLGGGRAPRAK